jgi:hypothetical protein
MSARSLQELIPAEHMKALEQVEQYCNQGDVISVTISTDTEYQHAATVGKELRFCERSIEDRRTAAKAPLLEEGRAIDKRYNDVKEMVKNRLSAISTAIRTWEQVIEQKRIEAQRQADEIARKERERIEEIARKERERENALLVEAEKKRQEALQATNEAERLRLEKDARAAESKATIAAEKAFIKENIAVQVVAPVVAAQAPAKGVSARDNWKFEGKDIKAFAKYCIDTDQCELLDFHTTNCNSKARAVKDTKVIPGIRIFNEPSTTYRR